MIAVIVQQEVQFVINVENLGTSKLSVGHRQE